jgi:hypothetical protein
MARKRHSDEDILKLLREIEVHLASGSDVTSAWPPVVLRQARGKDEGRVYPWLPSRGHLLGSQDGILRIACALGRDFEGLPGANSRA